MEPSSSPQSGPRQPAIRVVLMPKDTNALGTIFGGIILSYIDQAGAVEAHHHVPLPGRLVTVAMREIVFHSPVFVGDLVSLFTETLRIGRTSRSRWRPSARPAPAGSRSPKPRWSTST